MKKTSFLLLVFVISILFISSTQAQDFKSFAKDFIQNGTSSLANFKPYCESKIKTTDDEGNPTMEKPSVAYSYLKYFFKFKKYKIKQNKIIFKDDDEGIITIYFRQNSDGVWLLYKYDSYA